jgi:hypothetical protein
MGALSWAIYVEPDGTETLTDATPEKLEACHDSNFCLPICC